MKRREEWNVALGRKAAEAIARIETRGCARVCPPYGGSLERLPAAFWQRFEESLVGSGAEDALDASEWSLVQAAHDLGYDTGQAAVASAGARDLGLALRFDESAAAPALHEIFSALSGIGAADFEIIEIVPYERLVLRVYGYWGLLIPSPGRNRRRGTLVVRGLCTALMDLAYATDPGNGGYSNYGTYVCRQTRSVERGDLFDEFVTTKG